MSLNWEVGETSGWLHPDVVPLFDPVPRLDPYIVWAGATGCIELGGIPQGRFPIAIELKMGNTAKALGELIDTNGWRDWIWISSLYRFPPDVLKNTRFCTAHVTVEFFRHLWSDLSTLIERFTLGLPIVSGGAPRDDQISPDPQALASGMLHDGVGTVVIGVCDDGIAFAHQRFRQDSAGTETRFECFWNQDDPSNSTPGLGYGRELRRSDINQFMVDARRGGAVDEEVLYRMANYDAVARRWAHGTAVMDLACGVQLLRPPARDSEPEYARPLIGVQFRLPGRTMRDTSGLWLEVQALDAIRYVVSRTLDIVGPKGHALVNLSYGYIAGPHDGSSLLECAMDELMDTKVCSIVIPAGNSNLSRCHGTLSIAAGQEEKMRWRVMPDCLTPSFVEIWLHAAQGDPVVEVNIELPDGTKSGWIPLKRVGKLTFDGDTLCTVVHRGRGARGDAHMILVAVAPTVSHQPTRKVAPAGNWNIGLRNKSKNSGLTVDAWVQRNETPEGFPIRGRQSRFDDDNYTRFNRFTAEQDYDETGTRSWIRRNNTLNSIATGELPAVIGGWRKSDGTTAPYSATGTDATTGLKNHVGPDANAVSERSVVRMGVIAAGTRSSSAIPFEGTSAASPQVVRMLAANMPVPGLKSNVVSSPPSLRAAVKALAQTLTPRVGGNAPIRDKTFTPDELARGSANRNVGAGKIPSRIKDG
ncbi:hypothetical protein RI103_05620 [Paraburkholderia sp. FT54]|uniref:hypothetical protein n=1 Tax=Paraburkholderia sp. FT54 TaxID=3074437 RepID=UPI0028773E44|nr:hypothetical protein [Paraburkholderia sp. FT54]WNC90830.1 hypothetical protein RI103_05620 [Paraburkholderia sp. FT54]